MRPAAAVLVAGSILAACAAPSSETARALAQAAPAADATAGPSDETGLAATNRRLLAGPLGADGAVRVALLNNRAMRAKYFDVDLLDADLDRAIRATEPEAMKDAASHELMPEVERRFVLETIGKRSYARADQVARRHLDALRLRVAAEILQLAAETRRQYFAAVAAEESARYMAKVREAAAASSDLARRAVMVGNLPKVNELREQAFLGEVTAQLARAVQVATAERERLGQLMGVWGADAAFALPERLPELPAQPLAGEEMERSALLRRLDLQAAQLDILGETREMEIEGYEADDVKGALNTGRTAFVEVPEADFFAGDSIRSDGPPRAMRVPVFDRDQARVNAKMRSFMRSLDRYSEIAVAVRAEIRERYGAYRTAYDVARHYRDEILPLRRQISEENVLRYNGMLISVFELLADAREQIATVMAAIEAQRDFWQADAELRMALATGGGERRAASSLRAPAGAAAGH